VLRDPGQAADLEKLVRLTPFAREEFHRAYEPTDDPIERARRTIARAAMGFGTASSLYRNKTGFRAKSYLRNTTGPADFGSWPDHIVSITDRLRGVLIENLDALELIKRHDSPDTLFYVDPPYPHCTRSSINHHAKKAQYTHELTDAEHVRLAEVLREVRGMVIISGYACPLYEDLYGDWLRVERKTLADGARPRTECLWISPAAADVLGDR
jgi:DNA adenine methylase